MVEQPSYLIHGQEWSKHKYIKKIGNRYYYADDAGHDKINKAWTNHLSTENHAQRLSEQIHSNRYKDAHGYTLPATRQEAAALNVRSNMDHGTVGQNTKLSYNNKDVYNHANALMKNSIRINDMLDKQIDDISKYEISEKQAKDMGFNGEDTINDLLKKSTAGQQIKKDDAAWEQHNQSIVGKKLADRQAINEHANGGLNRNNPIYKVNTTASGGQPARTAARATTPAAPAPTPADFSEDWRKKYRVR